MNVNEWAEYHLKPPVGEDPTIIDIQHDPAYRDQINRITDVLECSRYRAAKMIRQSMLGIG